MKLEFDPMTEAAAVRRMLDALLELEVKITPASATFNTGLTPASAVPLPPAAPSTAAADVFPTAPEVPTPGAVTPPPVPVPPVPTAPTPDAPSAPALATSHAAVDKNGLPWDERIHSGSKEKNKDGSWRQRRSTEPDFVTEIEAQLRAALRVVPLAPSAPTAEVTVPGSVSTAPTAAPASPVTVPVPPVPEVPNAAPASSPVLTAPIPTPPAPPVPTAPAPTVTAISFAELMGKVTMYLRAQKIEEKDVHEALASVGLGPNEIGKLAKPDDESATHRLCVAAILDEKSRDV